eukprot:736546_1
MFKRIKSEILKNEKENQELINFNNIANHLVNKSKSKFIVNYGRIPTKNELKQSVKKLSTQLINKASKKYETVTDVGIFDLKMVKTRIIKSRTGISETYNVYFDECDKNKKEKNEKNLLAAIESFKMRNKREPTQLEVFKLKKFLSINKNTKSINFRLSMV